MHFRSLALLPVFLLLAACNTISTPTTLDAFHKLNARLDDPIIPNQLTVDNQPIEKVLHTIADSNNLNIVVNWTALGVAGVEKTTPVTLNLRDITIATALQSVLGAVNATTPLDFDNVDGILQISTQTDIVAHMSKKYVRKSYDVRDLITLPMLTGINDPNRRMIYLIDLITDHVDPASWRIVRYPDGYHPKTPQTSPFRDAFGVFSEVGGSGNTLVINQASSGEGVISSFNTSLIVYQTVEIQNAIEDLLEMLRKK